MLVLFAMLVSEVPYSLMRTVGLVDIPTEVYAEGSYESLVGTTTKVTFNEKPWYIIAYDSSNDIPTVTLLAADTSFGTSQFATTAPAAYSTSIVKSKLDEMVEEGGSFASVKDAIVDTNLTDVGVNGAKLYLLSAAEARQLSSNVRKINFNIQYSGYDGWWWLRSQGRGNSGNGNFYTHYVNGSTGVVNSQSDGYSSNYPFGVRPALKLNLESVIFDSETNTFSLKPPHTHSFNYGASGATITATCGNTDNCSLATDPTFTISAPENLIYDGSGKAAVIPAYDTTAFSYVSPITYEKDGAVYNGTPKEVGTYTAYVTAGENSENCATAKVSFTITKATPTITTNPSASAITYGQKLKDSTLTDGAGSVGGSFGWMSPETTPAVSDSDNTAYGVVFTPADTSNYNTVNLNVTVHVNKADNPASVANSAAVTVGGNTINLADCVTMNGATGAISYVISGESNGCTLNDSVLTSGDTVGSVTVNVTVSEDDNHNALATQVINVTISDKGIQSISAENVTATYGDTDKSVNATVTTPETDGGAIGYAVKPGSEEYIDVDASTGALTIKKTGTAIVVVTAEETATYAQATKEVTVTINKAESPSENPAPTPKEDLTDNGHPLELINPVTVTGGTIEYVIGTDDSTPPTSGWGPNVPTAAAPGTYYIWYKVVGDENHQDSVPKCIIVTIAEAPVPADTPSGYVKDVTGTNEASGNYTFGQRIVNNGDLKTLLSLSDDEVSQGTKVWLDVTELGSAVSDSDKALIEGAKGDYTVGMYLDINLYKKVGNNEAVKVTKTNGNVEVSLVMPENLRKEGRTYGIVRVHDNMAALISASYAGDSHLLTFKTDGFSTYAIVYKDGTNAGSNGSSNTSTGSNSSTGAATNIDTSIPKTDGATGLMGWYLALILSSVTLGALTVVSIKNRGRKKINK